MDEREAMRVWYSEGCQTEEGIAMPIGMIFWMLMILWLLFGLYWNRADLRAGNYGGTGGSLLLFVLLFLLGWRVFGFVVQ